MPTGKASPAPDSSTTAEHGLPPDTDRIDVLLCDINGILRGKRIPITDLDKLVAGQLMLPRGTVLLDTLGNASARIPYGYQDGDPDAPVLPVPGTLVPMPWSPQPVAQVLVSLTDADGGDWFANPRAVLARCLAEFGSRGLIPVVAIELEFHLFEIGTGLVDGDTPGHAATGGPTIRPAASFGGRPGFAGPQTCHLEYLADFAPLIDDIERAAGLQGIPLGNALSEFGAGQFEINLAHSADVVAACDQAILLKRIVRQCALRHGLLASFMARPLEGESGNGLHVHMSLLDDQGNNLFAGSEDELAETLQHAISGLLETLPASMALLAPNASSFQRLVPHSFVPLVADWGRDNRSVAIRLPRTDPANARFEHRVAGADANPTLVVAAVLAGVLQGLSSPTTLPAETSGPSPAVDAVPLPRRWHEALSRFTNDTVLPRWLGDAFCELYHTVKQDEEAQWHRDSAGIDLERYLRLM